MQRWWFYKEIWFKLPSLSFVVFLEFNVYTWNVHNRRKMSTCKTRFDAPRFTLPSLTHCDVISGRNLLTTFHDIYFPQKKLYFLFNHIIFFVGPPSLDKPCQNLLPDWRIAGNAIAVTAKPSFLLLPCFLATVERETNANFTCSVLSNSFLRLENKLHKYCPPHWYI